MVFQFQSHLSTFIVNINQYCVVSKPLWYYCILSVDIAWLEVMSSYCAVRRNAFVDILVYFFSSFLRQIANINNILNIGYCKSVSAEGSKTWKDYRGDCLEVHEWVSLPANIGTACWHSNRVGLLLSLFASICSREKSGKVAKGGKGDAKFSFLDDSFLPCLSTKITGEGIKEVFRIKRVSECRAGWCCTA